MSRVAKNPISIPKGVEVNINEQTVAVKGAKGQLSHAVHPFIEVQQRDAQLHIAPRMLEKVSRSALKKRSSLGALAGTTRALLNNLVVGVSAGFSKKLSLVGVGYRAQVQGNQLVLALGFSHPINYPLPAGISAKVPTPTEIEIEGVDKQLVGQVAAEVRAFRPPEPYKGKGVRYANETVLLKETKKK